MRKIIIALVFFNAALNYIQCGEDEERLPLAIEDDDYDELYNALVTGRMPIYNRNTCSRRIKRRLATGNYKIEEVVHPITGQVGKYIVSVLISSPKLLWYTHHF